MIRGVSFRGARLWATHHLYTAVTPYAARVVFHPRVAKLLPKLPSLPGWAPRRDRVPEGPWDRGQRPVPEELRTVAGIWRDPAQENEATVSAPLHDWILGNARCMPWLSRQLWRPKLPVLPRFGRATQHLVRANAARPAPAVAAERDAAALTAGLKSFAGAIGISAIGVARYDPNYEFAEFKGQNVGDRVIACVLEQNYAATQAIPSPVSEQSVFSTYAGLLELVAQVVDWLKAQGYQATGHGPAGTGIAIHYGVEAGLGQLGLNGQLLTPNAGSRCRVFTIYTDAPLDFDAPVDYGIHAVCDKCKACIRRCPVNAIPGKREWKRGVLKSKLDTERCAPIVAQVSGCGICIKVCPVQKYGLPAVIDELERSGEILGRGTDDLEGFDWPLDGRHYEPGRLPDVPEEIASPPGILFEAYPTVVDIDYQRPVM